MNATFFTILAIIFVSAIALTHVLGRAAVSETYGKYRIHAGKNPINQDKRTLSVVLNFLLPLGMYGVFFWLLGDRMLYTAIPRPTTLLGETLGVLLLYDFMYYFFHLALHQPALMRRIHGVHHKVRYTTADNSTYLHPGETFGGIGLLLLAVVILGPISTTSFLIMFFFYMVINIVVHSNLVFPHPAFRVFNFYTRSHDVHHYQCKHNYASLFPFWDQMFGTAR